MIGRVFLAVFAAFLFSLAPAVAETGADDGTIGTIVEVQGSATVMPEGAETAAAAAADTALHLNDTVQTGPDSRVFILFIDNTELVLSADTQVKIDDYVFDPDDNRDNKARYSVLIGAFQYVSGLIGKKENPDVEIATPVGAIGIRGTDFWAGELDGEYSVAVNEGQVALKTDAGEEVVNKGEGTSVRDRHARPARPKAWNREKLQRIADTVHLKRRELIKQRVTAMQDRQQALRGRYKEFMKIHRPDGQWDRSRLQERKEKWKERERERGGQLKTPENDRRAKQGELRQKLEQKRTQMPQQRQEQRQEQGQKKLQQYRQQQGQQKTQPQLQRQQQRGTTLQNLRNNNKNNAAGQNIRKDRSR